MLLVMVFGQSQSSPIIKVGDKQLGLSSLDVKVEVIGNTATTTYDMLFYNPTNRVLEGELSFPLGDGQNVSRFALEVNGKLREAVVVENELGRIAFEQVVRRGVDPALLEKGTGNNYKARIYPIPANGYKRVLVAYEQELVYREDAHYYNLPLDFNNHLDKFKLEMLVFEQLDKPIIEKGQISGLVFNNWDKNFRLLVEKENYVPNQSLLIKIPVHIDTEKVLKYEDYLYVNKVLLPVKRLRTKPKRIAIFWDASLSVQKRNLEKELQLLDGYIEYLGNVEADVFVFSNTLISKNEFKIVNGNWGKLRQSLETTIYDGATNYDILTDEIKDQDYVILFTDGMATLSDLNYSFQKPMFIVNSIEKSNHSLLRSVSEASNGSYINLNTKSVSEGIEGLKFEPYKYLGYKTNSGNLEAYPMAPVTLSNDFSISFKGFKDGDQITLNFGYDGIIAQKVPVVLDNHENSTSIVKRLWAKNKYEYLNSNLTKNKDSITKLGKEYSLVTDFTSLIVLENVMDYVVYKIEPPDELKDEYNRILAKIESDNKNSFDSNPSDAFIIDGEDIPITEQVQVPAPPGAPETINIVEDQMVFQEIEEEVAVTGFTNSANLEEVVEIEDLEVESWENDVNNGIPFSVIEIPPTFPGCEGTLTEKKECFSNKVREHVLNHFNMQISNDLGLGQGVQRIMVLFTINKNGQVENIMARTSNNRLEREMKRVIRLLPEMEPGKQSGRNISVSYSLPVIFRIGDDGQISEIEQEATVTPAYKKYSGQLLVNDRPVRTQYIEALMEADDINKAYNVYLVQRVSYINTPAYYIDVSNFFRERFHEDLYSSRILSNISESGFDNYELLRAYAYQLQFIQENELAEFIHERVLQLRPEDAQSYRDLALAYENTGKCQEALDLFLGIISGEIYKNNQRRNFGGLKLIAVNETKHLIDQYREELDLSSVNKELLEVDPFDIRVVIDWNHNDTDIDLHVIDPNLEECYYSHNKTNIGGSLSEDMTQGFGPEEFTLSKAVKGNYYVKIKYYGDRYQKVESPTFMKITMFKHYGTKNESKEIKIIRLTKNDNEEMVAKLSI